MSESRAATVRPYSLGLRAPLVTARGTIARREGALFASGSGEEPRGLGEAAPLPGWTEPPQATHVALGDARAALANRGWDAAVAATTGAPAARHAVSLARDDRRARREERPLYQHLYGTDGRREAAEANQTAVGLPVVESLPVNATVGDAAPESTAHRVLAAVGAGFATVKLKVGARSLAADRERLLAVRDRLDDHGHDDVTLRLDANGAWDRETAARALELAADLDVALVEQPVSAADVDGLASLRDRDRDDVVGADTSEGGVAIAADESLARGGPGLEAVLAGGAGSDREGPAPAVDAVVLKPMCLGGVVATVRAAARVRAAGVTPIVTTTIDAVIARTAAVHAAAAIHPDGDVACGLATADRLTRDLATDPAPVEDGRIKVPQGPGTGIDLGEVGD